MGAQTIELPKEEFKGSQCENVNWATVSAKSKSSRVYLIPESGKNFFGLNEIVLTTKDAKAASKLVDKIKSDLTGCKKTVLTASVSKPNKVTSIGAQNTKIAGWTAVVSQKSTHGTAKYRVGIVAAGPKVIYTFLNPQGDYDFTSASMGHGGRTRRRARDPGRLSAESPSEESRSLPQLLPERASRSPRGSS